MDIQKPEETTLVTQAEAARLLSISRTTLHRLVKAGELQQVHLGRRALVVRTSIDALIARKSAVTS
ncbi:helix-turn-helix transcriptional regulator [Aeromicrobium fastidiosum]|uniref:Helix-turn-helix domain-containing protein n=1 Tax=Aeromicrobium fastidiosum TaxID=52699 RepID=A0A641AL67_9ACTN|nr:helix-turn-helix domain-containing protein [Aeromicrobium fastidiosum]KAA1376113.1 helix-turn-helix domain-containing protein [Aeromicrobium fastidiosum]